MLRKTRRRKQKNANTAIASASFPQEGTGKGKPKPICRNFVTDAGCTKGCQCLYQHPNTVGQCLRRGSAKHVVADCKRPRRDPSSNTEGKGRSTSSTPSKNSSSQHPQAKAKAKGDPKKRLAISNKERVRQSRWPKPQPMQHRLPLKPILQNCCGHKL